MKCCDCGKIYKNSNSLKQHYFMNHSIKKEHFTRNKGGPAWNKGMTSKTHPWFAEKLKAGGRETARMLKDGELDGSALRNFYKSERGAINRKIQSERKKLLYKNHPEKHPNRKLANNRKKMSYPERLIYDYLIMQNINFEHQKPTFGLFPDFIFDKFIMEIDGQHFHKDKQKDEKRDQKLIEQGYIVVRIAAAPIKTLLDRFIFALNKENPLLIQNTRVI